MKMIKMKASGEQTLAPHFNLSLTSILPLFFAFFFPGNEAHYFFWGPKMGLFLGGGKKIYVDKVYVLFRSPSIFWRRLKGQHD